MTSFPYGVPILFRTPIWVPLKSDDTVAVNLKPLAYSTLSSNNEAQYIKQKDKTYFKYITYRSVLAGAIIDTQDAYGFPDIETFVNQLSRKDVEYLYDRLMELSDTTADQMDALDEMLTVQFHPAYQGPTWSCKACQAAKLDRTRGCGFLKKEDRDPAPYLPRLNGSRPLTCPISTMDAYVAQQSAMAFKMMDAGLLPEQGGMGDQTTWFVRSALLYKRKINEAERSALEASKSNT